MRVRRRIGNRFVATHRAGMGAYPSDSFYDPGRPSWLPYWLDTPTESAAKYGSSGILGAVPGAAVAIGQTIGEIPGGVIGGAVGSALESAVTGAAESAVGLNPGTPIDWTPILIAGGAVIGGLLLLNKVMQPGRRR